MHTLENQRVITLDKQQVLSQIGYDDGDEPSRRISSLVKDYIDNSHNLVDFSYSYIIRDIRRIKKNRVEIEPGITFESSVISKLLSKCSEVAVFALTIGSYHEEMVAHLAEDNMVLQATVLDAIGSGTAEQMAGFVENKIKETAAIRGMFTSRRFSPGYCDWDISQQEIVFKALGEDAGPLSEPHGKCASALFVDEGPGAFQANGGHPLVERHGPVVPGRDRPRAVLSEEAHLPALLRPSAAESWPCPHGNPSAVGCSCPQN